MCGRRSPTDQGLALDFHVGVGRVDLDAAIFRGLAEDPERLQQEPQAVEGERDEEVAQGAVVSEEARLGLELSALENLEKASDAAMQETKELLEELLG